MRRRGLAAVLFAVVATISASCGWTGGGAIPPDAERIGMVNATTAPVAVLVNGAWVGTYPAWSQQLELPIHGHGGPPWNVEFQGPNGLRIGVLHVDKNNEHPSSGFEYSSPCGEFHAWWGFTPGDLPMVDGTTAPPVDASCR